jgi:hypothetical protein
MDACFWQVTVEWRLMAKRRAANAERTLFQPPLHLLRGVTSRHNLRVAVGNGTDARQRNFSHPQAICGSEIPPCSPSRADLRKNHFTWFGVIAVQV